MNEYQFPRVASTALLLNEQNQLLLMRRSLKTRNDQGKWSIPGGAVEKQETVEESIVRECFEECGIAIKHSEYIGYIDHRMPEIQQHWVSHVFLVREWAGNPTNTEPEKCDEVRWFALEDIPENVSSIVTEALRLMDTKITQ